jgi:hypothetical protein
MGRACSSHVGDQKCVQNSDEKPEGMRRLGRLRRRYDDKTVA